MDILNARFAPRRLFIDTGQQSQQLEQQADNTLSQGIDHYQAGRYNQAAAAFKQAVSMAPASSYARNAADCQAMSYLRQGRSDKAVEAYKTGIRLDPTSDAFHVKLAKLHFAEERFQEARISYEAAVHLNPSAGNRFYLGQAYLRLEEFNLAEREFSQVQRLASDEPAGYFGLGQTYSKMARYEEAVMQFEEAIKRDDTFYSGYAELGYTYADMGRTADAEALVAELADKDPALSDTLARYIYKVDPPSIMFASSASSFLYTLPMRTPVAMLDSYLANAGASQTFKMEFQFDKEMSRESVEHRFNWEIGRARGGGAGDLYNFGFAIPDTEGLPPAIPDNVYYDERKLRAVVSFTLTQNDTADGTIDPSHIRFTFKGEDRFGNAMDPEADEFRGFSRVV
jgi:tetratricopeptide (TPR) repeat protein